MKQWYENLLREIKHSGERIFIHDPHGLLEDLNFHAELFSEFLIHKYVSDGDLYLFFNANSNEKILVYSREKIIRDFVSKNFNNIELTLKPVFPDLNLELIYQVDVSLYQEIYNYYMELKSHGKSLDTEQLILKSVWDIDLGELYSSTNNLKISLSYLIDNKDLPESLIEPISNNLGVNLSNLKEDNSLTLKWLENIILGYINELKTDKKHEFDLSNPLIQFYLGKIDYNLNIDPILLDNNIIEIEPWLANFKKEPSNDEIKFKITSELERVNQIMNNLLDDEFDLNEINKLIQLSKTFSKAIYHIQINDWPLDDFMDVKICYENLEKILKKLLEEDRFQLLFNYPYHQQPYTVDKILHYIMHQFKDEKVALIVMDGMSYDEWFLLKSNLKNFNFDENGVFAVLPTITSFSRTSIFSGKKPISFMKQNKIPQNTERDEFYNFLEQKGYSQKDILYGRIDLNNNLIKTKNENIEFEYLDDYRFLGLICNLFDDTSHHMVVYGDMKTNFYKNIQSGIKSSKITELLEKLHHYGYKIILTSDHGNIFCRSNLIKPNKNLEFEKRKSNRCIIFDNETFADALINENPGKCFKYKYNVIGNELTLVFASSTEFFSNKEGYSITHGGIMPEEWVVPLVIIK